MLSPKACTTSVVWAFFILKMYSIRLLTKFCFTELSLLEEADDIVGVTDSSASATKGGG